MKRKESNKISRDEFIANYIENGGIGAKAMGSLGLKGGSARTMASRYLQDPYVQEEIARRRKAIEEKCNVTEAMKIELLWDIASNDRSVHAVAELNKMQGHLKPTNVDIKSDEKPLGCALLILPPQDIPQQ